MNYFKKLLAFTLIVILAILFINQLYIDTILNKRVTLRTDRIFDNYINTLENKSIEYLFFGDSHTRDGANPLYIKDSFNYGSSSQNYIEAYYRLKKIVEKDNVRVKNVILEMDMTTFSSALYAKNRYFNDLYTYGKFVSISEIKGITGNSAGEILFKSNLPFIGNGLDFKYLFYKPNTEIYLGHTKRTEDLRELNIASLALNAYQNQFLGFERISNISMDYFIKTLKFCQDNHINIILITYPTTEYYNDFLNERGVTKEDYYSEIFNKINSELGQNYTYLNYYYLLYDERRYFANIDHLNYNGSIIFSQKLNEDLEKLAQK